MENEIENGKEKEIETGIDLTKDLEINSFEDLQFILNNVTPILLVNKLSENRSDGYFEYESFFAFLKKFADLGIDSAVITEKIDFKFNKRWHCWEDLPGRLISSMFSKIEGFLTINKNLLEYSKTMILNTSFMLNTLEGGTHNEKKYKVTILQSMLYEYSQILEKLKDCQWETFESILKENFFQANFLVQFHEKEKELNNQIWELKNENTEKDKVIDKYRRSILKSD